jgi:hypothetical protein
MVQVWKDKTCANDKYDPHRRKDRKTNMEIKKPYTLGQYSKFIIGCRQGRPVPQLLLGSEENCKMVKTVLLYLLNFVLLKAFFVYRTLNTGCISELGNFATLFFLVWQHWGGCRCHHFAAEKI